MTEFLGFVVLVAFVAGVLYAFVRKDKKEDPKPNGPVKEPNRPGPKP